MANAMNALVQSNKKTPFTVAIQSQGIQRMMQAAFSTPQAITKFTADMMAAVTATPGLKDCEPSSVVSACMQASALNLSTTPAMGEAWIIPYGDKATFQIGKNGLVQLAIRSGQYLDIDTIEVRQGEYKGRDKYTGKPLFEFIEDDEIRENLPVIGYLAYFEMLNGFKKTVYFSKEKMLKWAARYSPAFDIDLYRKYEVYQETGEGMTENELRKCSSPWFERFSTMSEKTVLRQLLQKWGVKSREMVTAIEQDTKGETVTDEFFSAAEEHVQPEPAPKEEVIVQDETAEKPVAKKTRAAKKVETPAATVEDDFFN